MHLNFSRVQILLEISSDWVPESFGCFWKAHLYSQVNIPRTQKSKQFRKQKEFTFVCLFVGHIKPCI